MVQAEYDLPEKTRHGEILSEDCRDLLQQILVADPAERLSVAQIQEHPWVKQDLPEGIATFNSRWIARSQGQRFDLTKIKDIVRQAKHASKEAY